MEPECFFIVDLTPQLVLKAPHQCTPDHVRWIDKKPTRGFMLDGREVSSYVIIPSLSPLSFLVLLWAFPNPHTSSIFGGEMCKSQEIKVKMHLLFKQPSQLCESNEPMMMSISWTHNLISLQHLFFLCPFLTTSLAMCENTNIQHRAHIS